MEDGDQNVHLKNLSSHQASHEEEALNLLFLGDTNRMIAEVTNKDYVCWYLLQKESLSSLSSLSYYFVVSITRS